MRALAEVEQTLARLKQARAERAESEARYKAELAQRDERERAITAARDAAASALADAHARVQALESELAIAQTAGRTELDRLGLERDGALAACADLEARMAALQSELAQSGEQKGRLEHALAQAEADRAELIRLQETARDLGAQLEASRQQVERLQSEAAGAGSESERWRGEAQAAAAEIEALRARVATLDGETAALRDQAAATAERSAALASEHESRVQALGSELDRLREALDAATREGAARAAEAAESAGNAEILGAKISEQSRRIEELEASLTAARASLESHACGQESAAARVGELSAELERVRAENARLENECRAALAAAADVKAGAEGVIAERLAALESIRSDLESRLGAANEQLEALRRTGDTDASLREELESLRTRFDEVTAERDRFAAQAREASAQLGAEKLDIESMRGKLDLAAERLLELQAGIAERDEIIAAAAGGDGAELGRVRDELARTKAALASAQAHPKGRGRGAASPEAAARLALRKRRLARYRRALRDRQAQSERASALLADRVKLCDELLARRRELAEAREVVERTHRKVIGERARSSSAAVVFFGAGLLTVLAAGSWTVVNHFFPATYAATAVLAADFRGVTPASGEPEAWQEFHQQLLGDPQLLGRVAERMGQRGFEELGAPASVKAKLDRDLSWSTPEPGKLVLELRGVGKEATARMLDVYSTTVEVEANALRQRRSDTAQTVVSERARPGNEPVLDERPMRAAIGLGAAATVAFLVWTGIWRRMVKTKQAFENPERIDHLLEEARWVDPIQKIIEAHAESPRAGGKAA
ncbi:MAG TPA: hypothetical protein VFF69_08675 [Phycisphaerales bacterium]|nr:hypothetical protein [Phycisphaerales bacterium]